MLKQIYRWYKTKKLTFRLKNFEYGENFVCGRGCFVSPKNTVKIGNDFFMGNYCHIGSDLKVGSNVMFASFVSCVGGDHKFEGIGNTTFNKSGRDEFKTTIIEDNVWIGHGSIILHGITIKSGSIIAAGSVVTKDVEPNSIVGGNPAKLIRKRKI